MRQVHVLLSVYKIRFETTKTGRSRTEVLYQTNFIDLKLSFDWLKKVILHGIDLDRSQL